MSDPWVCVKCKDAARRRSRFYPLFCVDCIAEIRKIDREQRIGDAQQIVTWEIWEGRLPKASTLLCVDCGKKAHDWDHRDYNKPLDLEPVCAKCNQARGPGIPLKSYKPSKDLRLMFECATNDRARTCVAR